MRKIEIDIEEIKKAIKAKQIIIRQHAKIRMAERGISYREVIEAILGGEIIESYQEATPFPCCLVMGYVRRDKPLYIVCAFDGNMVYIITTHWHDPAKWVAPGKRRKDK